MTKRMLIPRHLIPKVHAMCIICESGNVATKVASPFADGYYRRHECRGCGAVFHSLAPYDGSTAQVSMVAFKDRELSEYEAFQRMQAWKDLDKTPDATLEVTLLTRMSRALNKKEETRSDIERYIVSVYYALQKKVREMEEKGNTS